MGQPRLNLSKVHCLLTDRDQFTRGLVAQMLRGFGMGSINQAGDGETARDLILKDRPDVCFLEGDLPDTPTAQIIDWIRKQPPPLRFIPIIVMTGYTQLKLISEVRDSGANLVVRKPVSPQALFDRLAWIANTQRPFIETDNFHGPDRRFHDMPPPDNRFKRDTDIVAEQPQ
ncbi:MAG: response regulator [Alphaproteobacteria bacterium]|nr:response regulator [Alphaproteobacteria bacterium]